MPLNLRIPAPLEQEFATVDVLWRSRAATRRVDALILSWTKYEKQLRRLFCFLVFQHPKMNESEVEAIIEVLVDNKNLYPGTFIAGIEALGVTPVRTLLEARHKELSREIERIQKYRNKLIHGQITGQQIASHQLERDILWIIDWVASLAAAAEKTFGYDGIKRNTYRVAKATSIFTVTKYPFVSPEELKAWLKKLTKIMQRKQVCRCSPEIA